MSCLTLYDASSDPDTCLYRLMSGSLSNYCSSIFLHRHSKRLSICCSICIWVLIMFELIAREDSRANTQDFSLFTSFSLLFFTLRLFKSRRCPTHFLFSLLLFSSLAHSDTQHFFSFPILYLSLSSLFFYFLLLSFLLFCCVPVPLTPNTLFVFRFFLPFYIFCTEFKSSSYSTLFPSSGTPSYPLGL